MKNTSAIFLIVFWLVGSASGYAEKNLVGTNGVPLAAFSNIQRGISVDAARKMLNAPGEHQFTALHENLEYLCLHFLFEEPRVGFYLIFTNNYLKAVVEPPKAEFERVPYKGSVWEKPKPIESEATLQSVLAAKDLSKNEIENRIRNAPRKGKESLNVLPAFIITAPLFALRAGDIADDNRRNAELVEKFNPLKVKIGTTVEDVEGIFGKPYQVSKISPSKSIHAFGSDESLPMNTGNRFSWVAVVFENGKATRVFSHRFFDKRLKEGK